MLIQATGGEAMTFEMPVTHIPSKPFAKEVSDSEQTASPQKSSSPDDDFRMQRGVPDSALHD